MSYLTALHQVNEQATEGQDWFSQVEDQVDGHGVTIALTTTFLKPYFTSQGKPAFSKTDGYTVELPSLRIRYHDRRTEFVFKKNENKLERLLEKLLKDN